MRDVLSQSKETQVSYYLRTGRKLNEVNVNGYKASKNSREKITRTIINDQEKLVLLGGEIRHYYSREFTSFCCSIKDDFRLIPNG